MTEAFRWMIAICRTSYSYSASGILTKVQIILRHKTHLLCSSNVRNIDSVLMISQWLIAAIAVFQRGFTVRVTDGRTFVLVLESCGLLIFF
eukprot:3769010-Amphidinium_carterae.1